MEWVRDKGKENDRHGKETKYSGNGQVRDIYWMGKQ
jgi:hypothetical protein